MYHRRLLICLGIIGMASMHFIQAQQQEITPSQSSNNTTVISQDTVVSAVSPFMIDGKPMTEKQRARYYKQLRRDSIRAKKNIWWSILGGPSYTPEASFGVGGAVLASFRLNKHDTVS